MSVAAQVPICPEIPGSGLQKDFNVEERLFAPRRYKDYGHFDSTGKLIVERMGKKDIQL
jgi:hypothetical protein